MLSSNIFIPFEKNLSMPMILRILREKFEEMTRETVSNVNKEHRKSVC